MTMPRHDFTQPPPLAPQLRVNLAQWLTRSNALLVELLAGHSTTDIVKRSRTPAKNAAKNPAKN